MCKINLARVITAFALCIAAFTVGSAHAGDSTTVIPGDGPICTLVMPATISFNTTLSNSVTVPLVGNCTRFPVKWEWTAPPLDYTGRNMAGDNALFQPLFDSGIMSWTYDNRKVTNTNTINLTFSTTGTHTFAVRAKDADYIPPNNQPAGFWGPWGAPGFNTIDGSGAWQTITLTCSAVDQTRTVSTGGVGVCTGGRLSTVIETRTFCADSKTPIFGPWVPSNTCSCPSGKVWDGGSCVPVPICTVRPLNPAPTPGQSVPWVATCDQPVTTLNWVPTTPPAPPVAACPSTGGALCTQIYPTPQTVCYAVAGTGIAGVGPTSAPACATVACAPPTLWNSGVASCGTPPTITPPTFIVGVPQPPFIPIAVTGTTPTCSAVALPPGWTMSSTCMLSPTLPGAPQPPVPASCTVTATNPWGSDTKPCIATTFTTPSCSANFTKSPVVLTPYTLFAQSDPIFGRVYNDSANPYLAGASGTSTLQIALNNGDTVQSISCTGADGTPTVGATSGQANGHYEYAVSYSSLYSVAANTYTVNYSPPIWQYRFTDSNGVEFGDTVGSRDYNVPAQTSRRPATPSVCTVTVKNSVSNLTATCSTTPTEIVDSGTDKFCSIDLSMQRWVYTSGDGTTQREPIAELGSAPSSSSFSRDFDPLRPPNTGYLTGRVYSSAQLGPSALAQGDANTTKTDQLTCRKKVRTASNPNAAFSAPFGISPSTQSNFGSFMLVSAIRPGGTTMQLERLGPVIATFGATNIYGTPSSPVVDSFDPGATDYDIECTLTASGFDTQAGVAKAVSCGAYYSYRAGAVCQFEGVAGAGVTVETTEFSGGGTATQYTNPKSEYNGVFKYLADSGKARFVSIQDGAQTLTQSYNGVEMMRLDSGSSYAPAMLGNPNTLFDLNLAPSPATIASSPNFHGVCNGYCEVGAVAVVKRVLFGDRQSSGTCSVDAAQIGRVSTNPSCPTCTGASTTTTTVINTDGTTTTTGGTGGSTVGNGPVCTGAGC